ncbi:hypothetical protein UNDKW_0200 [Undibacterium sp. KW1]|nr:hypothetical protein UNDKW_0200 [Undibacterium sp. KW1]
MGLAAYGDANDARIMKALLKFLPDVGFELNPIFFDQSGRGYSKALSILLDIPPRKQDDPVEKIHADIARCAQELLETALLDLARMAVDQTGQSRLCVAGGVALNCVANARIRDSAIFEHIFCPPGAGDCGSAIGAARLAHFDLAGCWPAQTELNPYLGPSYKSEDIQRFLREMKIPFRQCGDEELAIEISARIARGETVGWFQGRMEFGPRSLGGRSILADPRNRNMRDHLNSVIKKREGFRPFAPICLPGAAKKLFEHSVDPYMTFVTKALSPERIPSAVHVDGSARIQTTTLDTPPRLLALLEKFELLTDVGCLLNTSFNMSDEPIVCSPKDAFNCFRESGLDILVLEDLIVTRVACPPEIVSSGAKRLIEYSREVRPFISDTYSFN